MIDDALLLVDKPPLGSITSFSVLCERPDLGGSCKTELAVVVAATVAVVVVVEVEGTARLLGVVVVAG